MGVKTRWPGLMMAAMLAGCQPPTTVDDAWVRLPAVPGRPAAAYAILSPGSSDDALIGITTPAAGRVELHESMNGHGGMAGMRPLQRLPLPRDRTAALKPGGAHAMLFDLTGDPRAGSTIPLTFRFDRQGDVTVTARLVGAGDPAPE